MTGPATTAAPAAFDRRHQVARDNAVHSAHRLANMLDGATVPNRRLPGRFVARLVHALARLTTSLAAVGVGHLASDRDRVDRLLAELDAIGAAVDRMAGQLTADDMEATP